MSAMRLPFAKGMIGAILPPNTAGLPCYLENVGSNLMRRDATYVVLLQATK